MCCSALGQIVYGALMLVCLGLTVVSMFTPGWTKLEQKTEDAIKNQTVPKEFGLFNFACTLPGEKSDTTDCKKWFEDLPNYYKVVIGAMILAVILEIIALVWNLITFCACCCKKHIIHPLYGLAVGVAILLAIAVVVFYVNNKNVVDNFNGNDIKDSINESGTSYSFYLACGAFLFSVAAILAGIFSACCADIHC